MKFKFEINVPNRIYRFRWKNVKNYLTWVFKPHRCYVCNTRLAISKPDVEYYFDADDKYLGKYKGRLLATWDVEHDMYDYANRPRICKDCLAAEVKDENATPKRGKSKYYFDELKNTCDCCGKKKRSFKWTAFKVHGKVVEFITGNYCSWNSAHYCADCISKAVKEGIQKTSYWTSYKGKGVCIQQNGLPVVDGKVKFPDR